MILFHGSDQKFKILKPLKPEDFSEDELNHESVLWLTKDFDYAVLMVLFRFVEDEYQGVYRLFDHSEDEKVALFYPDKYGPILDNKKLFNELYQRSVDVTLKQKNPIFIHLVNNPKDLQKTNWDAYYTKSNVLVDQVKVLDDGLKFLVNNSWEVRIVLD